LPYSGEPPRLVVLAPRPLAGAVEDINYSNSEIEHRGHVVRIAAGLHPRHGEDWRSSTSNRAYMERGDLFVEVLARGFAWLDTRIHASSVEAQPFHQNISWALTNRSCPRPYGILPRGSRNQGPRLIASAVVRQLLDDNGSRESRSQPVNNSDDAAYVAHTEKPQLKLGQRAEDKYQVKS
jgi:dTDP-glucose pyrophosphorylase